MGRRARGGWKDRKDPVTWAKVLERRAKRLLNQTGKAVAEVTDATAYAARLLAIPARKVSRQDAPGGKPLQLARKSPVRSKVIRSQLEGRVWVAAFWTAARTKAVIDIHNRFGQQEKLKRRWLWVKRRVANVRTRGSKLRKGDYVNTGFYDKKFMNRDPKLRQWAINVKQDRRHVVYLKDKGMRRDLVLAASINDTKRFAKQSFKKAAKGFSKG